MRIWTEAKRAEFSFFRFLVATGTSFEPLQEGMRAGVQRKSVTDFAAKSICAKPS